MVLTVESNIIAKSFTPRHVEEMCLKCKNYVEADINPLFSRVRKVCHCNKGITVSFQNCSSFESNN